MDGASPWACNFDALEFYGPYQATETEELESETEELESEEESMSYESSESSASASSSVEVVIPFKIFRNIINSRNRRSGKRRRINDSYEWSD